MVMFAVVMIRYCFCFGVLWMDRGLGDFGGMGVVFS